MQIIENQLLIKIFFPITLFYPSGNNFWTLRPQHPTT